MTRGLFLLTAGLLSWPWAVLGGVAHGQDLDALRARYSAAQALQDARRDVLASQIEATNARERADTAARLRGLEARRGTPDLRPLTVPPPRAIEPPGQRDAELSATAGQLERLTQAALAESNARMRAIRPASEPKQR